MNRFTRPTFNVDNDDLERLQQEFFAGEQTPSAKVYRKSNPPSVEPKKKRSLFAERLAKQNESLVLENTDMPALEDPTVPTLETSNMPILEDPTMPTLETPNMPTLETSNMPTLEDSNEPVTYEPVVDPNPEPHVPVSKKMLDLTSLLGQVLGDIKENDASINTVKPPTLNMIESENKPARGQHNGFPKPVHRSEFKKRLEAQRQEKKQQQRLEKPPQVESQSVDMYEDENDRRIQAMSEQELEDARAEIMNTLSPESIELLMKGLKNRKKPQEKKVTFAEEPQVEVVEDTDDLIKMKEQYFPKVPLENEKLAWMDPRFLTPELIEKQKEQQEQEQDQIVTEVEKVYRQVRFDLQGRFIDPKRDIPYHQGLHHHGDDPDKAGYTLSELFYLTRSQVPSQRAMVLTTLARIIQQAKKEQTKDTWKHVWGVFTMKDYAASIYLRSALDDRNLVVLVSAIHALSALVLDTENVETDVIETTASFNEFLGHIAQPILPQGAEQFERKGLNEKLSELVDRVRQGQKEEADQKNDAELAEKDLIRGLIQMNILPRIRYLMSTKESELMDNDSVSVDRLVRLLVRFAAAGQDVCELIVEEELLEPVVEWGLVQTQWPMMTTASTKKNYPCLSAVRLLTLLAQSSKEIAEGIAEKATMTLRFLVTSPEIAYDADLKRKAYALQLETLKLIRVLACYGYILPTLEDLQEPVMGWLRSVLLTKDNQYDVLRASTAIGLLEVLLHVAADPHKSIPAHAIDWHQPTAYLPAVLAVLRSSQSNHMLFESALGYLGSWATFIRKFPPEQKELVRDVWKAVVQHEINGSHHRVLRFVQFLTAYYDSLLDHSEYQDIVQDAQSRLKSFDFTQQQHKSDVKLRYAFWIWLSYYKTWVDTNEYSLKALEYGVQSKQMGVVESWLSKNLLEMYTSKEQLGGLTSFYIQEDEAEELAISKSLFSYDGRSIKTLMYTIDSQASLEITEFMMRPIDAFYHLDKSRVAQKSELNAAEVVKQTMKLTEDMLDTMNHDMLVVTLMKVFLIGDREGRSTELESDDREIFWEVEEALANCLEKVCTRRTRIELLEGAWRKSSEYIRQPFFQFYQAFVAHYAAVSFGHHGFARLLVYLVTQIETIDYRHLLFSDYRETLPTLSQIKANEIPTLTKDEWKQLEQAGLILRK